ncbi:MAG TPA: hypothetical protein VGM05_21665 [Planctomycetaceae bacterium]|jgi:hypothetical protein
MSKTTDTRLIMMVAQNYFETPDLHQFCKLIPLVYVEGTRASASDFPNDGEIWWMLTAETARLAEPGRLVVGQIENAIRYDEHDPRASSFQVKRDSVQDLNIKDGFEIVELPGDGISEIQDVVAARLPLEFPVRPTPSVMLRWRANIYGPFVISRDAYGVGMGEPTFTFAPANTTEMTVYRIDQSVFDAATAGHRFTLTDEVSFTTQRRSESFQLTPITHDLVLASGYERVLATNPPKVVLEPVDRKLLRYARQTLTRRRRQELQSLLREMELGGREIDDARELIEAIGHVTSVTEKQEAALDLVAKALLASGLLGEDRIAKAEQAFAEKYIQGRTAELQAKAEESLGATRDELRRAEVELKEMQARIKMDEIQHRMKLEQDLSSERQKARDALDMEREEFGKQKVELHRQQNLLQHNLEKVTKDLREAGDDVVNRFLTIAPLLGSFGAAGTRAKSDEATNPGNSHKEETIPDFVIPSFVTESPNNSTEELSEEAFFDRFRRFVEDSGFVYRPIDLLRFHLSVKCGELVVLGGPSGTGKSSLPALYSQALLGEESRKVRPGCLMINVSPSWMDARDLIGHLNSLDGLFYPADSGLFQQLIYAHEEHQLRGSATGLHVVCLDEMNLAQVEHYFGDFMMVLERTGASRHIQCFSADVAATHCRFRRWGRIALSPALRFIGTVNFDETTRLLSDRFLDRVNMIRLSSATLPGVGGGVSSTAIAAGRLVTFMDMESWCSEATLPADLASLLDQMRPHLREIGCPISPRVYRGICRFVGSSTRLMSPTKAFDLQVVQRIIPRIRGVVTKRQLDALDELLRTIRQTSVCEFDEATPLLEEVRDSAGTRAWDLEE